MGYCGLRNTTLLRNTDEWNERRNPTPPPVARIISGVSKMNSLTPKTYIYRKNTCKTQKVMGYCGLRNTTLLRNTDDKYR